MLLYCYYKPVVEGNDPRDDTERYAFRDTTGKQDKEDSRSVLGGLLGTKKEEKCERNAGAYKNVSEIKGEVNEAGKYSPICFKDIKCTDLLMEKKHTLPVPGPSGVSHILWANFINNTDQTFVKYCIEKKILLSCLSFLIIFNILKKLKKVDFASIFV